MSVVDTNKSYPHYKDETTQQDWYKYFEDKDIEREQLNKLLNELHHGIDYANDQQELNFDK